MHNKKVIEQLESLKANSKSFMNPYDPDDIWTDDIIALDVAIRSVKKDKRSKTEFWKGVAFGFISFVVFYALHNL